MKMRKYSSTNSNRADAIVSNKTAAPESKKETCNNLMLMVVRLWGRVVGKVFLAHYRHNRWNFLLQWSKHCYKIIISKIKQQMSKINVVIISIKTHFQVALSITLTTGGVWDIFTPIRSIWWRWALSKAWFKFDRMFVVGPVGDDGDFFQSITSLKLHSRWEKY